MKLYKILVRYQSMLCDVRNYSNEVYVRKIISIEMGVSDNWHDDDDEDDNDDDNDNEET